MMVSLEIVQTRAAFLSYATPSVQRYFGGMQQSDRDARHPHAHSLDAYLGHLEARPPPSVVRVFSDLVDRAATAISSNCAMLPAVMRTTSDVLPWRIAFFHPSVERGWPHTHGTTLCFPLAASLVADCEDSEQLRVRRILELLVHERIHVLQRVHPQATRALLKKLYGPHVVPRIARAMMPSSERSEIYANPDVDEYEYYKIRGSQRHPYEAMAYRLAALAVSDF